MKMPQVQRIPLQPDILHRLGREGTIQALERIGTSTRLVLDEAAVSFRLAGPMTPYHAYDPDLAEVLSRYWPRTGLDAVAAFHRAEARYDLCFEDGWSGLFIARALAGRPSEDDLILLHLDDHTDMMPTLLERRDGVVTDPATGQAFDPDNETAWQCALTSGAVSIGSFVTALCQGRRRVHVRHLNNVAGSWHQCYPLARASERYAVAPHVAFATVRKLPAGREGDAGSYRGGPEPSRVLAGLPVGIVVVHIDLDYLVNDYNGNEGQVNGISDRMLKRIALEKLDRFFAALAASGRSVLRWIVGTSPGFCAARHWPWLLEDIAARIQARGEA
jgi:hypothetical protein